MLYGPEVCYLSVLQVSMRVSIHKMQIGHIYRSTEKIKGHQYYTALKPHCKQFTFAHKHFTKNSNTVCIDPHPFSHLVIEQLSDPKESTIQKKIYVYADTIEISVDIRTSII